MKIDKIIHYDFQKKFKKTQNNKYIDTKIRKENVTSNSSSYEESLYITTDGEEFEEKWHAEEHEFHLKTKMSSFSNRDYFFHFDSKADFLKWIQYEKLNFNWNHYKYIYDVKSMTFPSWYAISEEFVNPFDEKHLIITVFVRKMSDYKKIAIERINNLPQ